MAAWLSIAVELITGPRFTGADHSELAKNMAWMPYTISSDSGPQAISATAPSTPVQRFAFITLTSLEDRCRALKGWLGVTRRL